MMFTLPLITYYLLDPYLGYKTATAGAVVVVNIVIAGYVYSAFSEDDEEGGKGEGEHPRVGIWKGRGKTD